MYDAAVIGSGAAGLMAAGYMAQSGRPKRTEYVIIGKEQPSWKKAAYNR